MSEWKEYKLTDVCLKITDGSHFSPPTVDIGYPMASVKDMMENRIALDGCRRISKENYLLLVKNDCKPKLNDVLIAKDGSFLKHIFDVTKEEEVVLLSSIAIIRPNQNKVISRFLKYIFKNPSFQEVVEGNFVTGAVIPRIVLKDFKKIDILLPPLPEQKAIASVLSSLDDKIDLLHRQNKTLEAMAETLFRQWFVEEAQDDWEEGSLLEIIDLVGGGTPKTSIFEYWDGSVPWLSGGNIASNHKAFVQDTPKHITEIGLSNSAAKLLPKHATVISARGTVGKYCMLAQPMAFSQSNYGILPKNSESYFFTYLLINHVVEELQSSAYGSVFDTITTTTFKGHEVLLPSRDEIIQFDNSVSGFFEKMLLNKLQIRTIEKLRDTLLPKLMSGEVRVTV